MRFECSPMRPKWMTRRRRQPPRLVRRASWHSGEGSTGWGPLPREALQRPSKERRHPVITEAPPRTSGQVTSHLLSLGPLTTRDSTIQKHPEEGDHERREQKE